MRRALGVWLLVLTAGCAPAIEVSRAPEPDATTPAAAADPPPATTPEEPPGDLPPEATTPATPAARSLRLVFGGDVHGEPPVADLLAAGGNPLAAFTGVLADSDLAAVNLETAVGATGAPEDKSYVFQAPPALLDALVSAGVSAVSVANNHAGDHGSEGLAATIALARAAGLAVVGGGGDASEAYAPHIAEAGERTVALLGLTRVIPFPYWAATPGRPGVASVYDHALPDAVAAVAAARDQADVVVVSVHWGREGSPCPDETQTLIARALVTAGADVIVGHHPHVLQGVQELDGAIVAYSLGNLVWYAAGEATRATGLLSVEVPPDADPTWELLPALVTATGAPEPATADGTPSAAGIADLVRDRSPGGATCAHVDWP